MATQAERPAVVHDTIESLQAALNKRAAYQEEFDAIETYLKDRGWRRQVNLGGESEFTGYVDMLQVQLSRRGWWALGKFTDSDIETEWGLMAVGRYETLEEGENLDELKRALQNFCEFCGGEIPEGTGRYYPGGNRKDGQFGLFPGDTWNHKADPLAYYPKMERVCGPCEAFLLYGKRPAHSPEAA